MEFSGIQKLTLLDYPGKVACTLFTGGCNYRCPFCHNASLVLRPEENERHSEQGVLAFLKKRQGILDGVCVTGGEPLLHPGLGDFLKEVKALGFAVKLDTNGSRPDFLRALVEARLVDYVAMDIKNSLSRYAQTVGLPEFDTEPVKKSAAFLLSGAVDYEFRTTVVRGFHDEAAFLEIADWISGARRYYLQSFVDSGDLICPGLEGFSRSELEGFRTLLAAHLPCVELRGI